MVNKLKAQNVHVKLIFIFGCAGSSLLYGLFSSCGTQAKLPCSICDLPRSGIEFEFVSPALTDGFFTTDRPRKP